MLAFFVGLSVGVVIGFIITAFLYVLGRSDEN